MMCMVLAKMCHVGCTFVPCRTLRGYIYGAVKGHRKARVQMIRVMHDSRRPIGRFAQDDSRKNGDDSCTKFVVFEGYIL